jgi:hypothetical protein
MRELVAAIDARIAEFSASEDPSDQWLHDAVRRHRFLPSSSTTSGRRDLHGLRGKRPPSCSNDLLLWWCRLDHPGRSDAGAGAWLITHATNLTKSFNQFPRGTT